MKVVQWQRNELQTWAQCRCIHERGGGWRLEWEKANVGSEAAPIVESEHPKKES